MATIRLKSTRRETNRRRAAHIVAAGMVAVMIAFAAPLAWAQSWSREAVATLQATARQAESHGLPPRMTSIARLDDLAGQIAREPDLDERAFLQALLDAEAERLFDRLTRDFGRGGVDPALAEPSWTLPLPDLDRDAARRAAIEAPGVTGALGALLPNDAEYRALVDDLAAARAEGLAADNPRIVALRANLERRRWLPRPAPVERLEVRTPWQSLEWIQDGATRRTAAVIVGAPKTPSPSLAANIEAVTLNPTWTPPSSILLGELAPAFAANPESAAAQNYAVFDLAGRRVHPALVDWRARPLAVQVVQQPGPGNALGHVKFEMPNRHAVYLHDTPARALFARRQRALSHGCIRVENPRDLAADMLDEPAWTRAAIDAAIAEGATHQIRLQHPLPIWIVYLTARVNQAGAIEIAPDLYGRDARLVAALDAGATAQAASASPCAP